MPRTTNRFEKGSGCYNCKNCGRRTRSTGRGDNENLELCVECYDIAGLENQISDCGDPDGSIAKQIEELVVICRAKGGEGL